jgi:hypothetical protein
MTGAPGVAFWCAPVESYQDTPEFLRCGATEQCDKRRWIPAPVRNSHIVGWVCRNLTIPVGGMVVVNWTRLITHITVCDHTDGDSEYQTVAAAAAHQTIHGMPLCDQHIRSPSRITGKEDFTDASLCRTRSTMCSHHSVVVSRFLQTITVNIQGRVRFGEVLRVTGTSSNSGGCQVLLLYNLQLSSTGLHVTRSSSGHIVLTQEEVASACRPARLATLRELLNSHYSERPVFVVLSHTSSRSPAFRQEWDPLYVSLGLGGVKNWTIIANDGGLQSATEKMKDTLRRADPYVPPVWQRFVLTCQKKPLTTRR